MGSFTTLSSRLAFLIAMCGLALAPSRGAEAESPLAGSRFTELPNGLRVIHREHHSAPLIAIDVWVKAGSRREGPGESGASHFLEHLLFKGTPTRRPGEIDAAIEDLGATLAAGTTRDGAHFYTTVASEHAGEALGVVADALQNASLDPAEMERERTVILDEIARGYNDGRKQAINALYAQIFADQSMGRSILGTADAIKSISRETVEKFYRRWYVPNNATVVIVGDIEPDEVDKLARKHFGDWKRRALPDEANTSSSVLPFPAPDPVPGPAWLAAGIAFMGVSNIRPEVGEVVARLLADGDFGRIPQFIREAGTPAVAPVSRRPTTALVMPRPLLHGLAVEFSIHRGGGLLLVTAGTIRSDSVTAFKPIEDALAALRKEGLAAQELDHARRRAIGFHLFAVETYAGQARALGEAEMAGDYRAAVEWSERIQRVTEGDVAEFAQKWLTPMNLGRAIIPAKASK